MNLPDIYERIRVVATSIVTLATALAVIISQFVDAVVPALPDGWQDNAVSVGGMVVGALGAAVVAIRRVTGVPADERGLLPRVSDVEPDDTPHLVT